MYQVYGAKVGNPMIKGLVRENRVIWFCEEAGIPYERVSLDPAKGENKAEAYSKINPFNKVPSLVLNETPADKKVLTQSAAIVWYLAQKHHQLLPKDPWEMAKAMEWMMFIVSDLEPHCGPLHLQLKMVPEADLPHAQWQSQRAEGFLNRAFDYLETTLGEKTFLLGSQFSFVDVILGCTLLSIREHGIVTARPRLKALLERYYSRPAFKKAWELNGT